VLRASNLWRDGTDFALGGCFEPPHPPVRPTATNVLPLRGLVSQFKLLSKGSKFCPDCYAEDERKGHQKYNRLLWSFDCVVACPLHELDLVWEKSPSAANPLPFTLPGISRSDGKSLARCHATKASAYNVHISRLVAELLDDIVHLSEVLPETPALPAFLQYAINQLFGGKAAHFAKHVGVNKSDVYGWMYESVCPSLARVAHIAYCCGCTIADVLIGNKVMLRARAAPSRGPQRLSKKQRTGWRTPREILLTQLREFMATHETACARDAANALGITTRFLRSIAPRENAVLVEQGNRHRSSQVQAARDAKDEAYRLSQREIEASGVYASRRKVVHRVHQVSGLTLGFSDIARARRKVGACSKPKLTARSRENRLVARPEAGR
jgi:TniQ